MTSVFTLCETYDICLPLFQSNKLQNIRTLILERAVEILATFVNAKRLLKMSFLKFLQLTAFFWYWN